jgi:glycosyltransferase involved in cell wall biosynthesis
MKIALLCQFEDNTANAILMNGRAETLAQQGHQVVFIIHPFKYTGVPSDTFEQKQNNYQKICRYSRMFRKPRISFPLWFPAFFLLDFIPALFKIRRSDVFFMHKPLPLGLFYLFFLKLTFYRGKIISIFDDWEGIGGFVSLRNANSFLNRMLVSFSEELTPSLSDYNLCVSKILYDKLCLTQANQHKTLYLPNGASEPETLPPPYKPKPDTFEICYVGTFKSQKLIDFLLEICVRLAVYSESLHFIFIGGGDDFNYLQTQVKAKGLESKLKLTGQLAHKEVAPLIINTDLCLLPLFSEYPETFMDASRSSTKMFEYMSLGKLILASDFGEPANILKPEQTGFLCANNLESFFSAIKHIYENRHNLGLVSQQVAQDFREHYSHAVLMNKMITRVQNDLKKS